MKLADVKQTEMDLRHLAEKFEKEYWSIAKQLQNRNFKSRSDQRMAMQTQVEVFEALTALETALAKVSTVARNGRIEQRKQQQPALEEVGK